MAAVFPKNGFDSQILDPILRNFPNREYLRTFIKFGNFGAHLDYLGTMYFERCAIDGAGSFSEIIIILRYSLFRPDNTEWQRRME